MQTHVRIGYELMSRVAFLASASQIVLTHQECYDGIGYPQGLMREEIPLGARIFAIADTLDAMLSDRPYRRGRSYRSPARKSSASREGNSIPQVVAAFLEIPEETWMEIRSEATRKSSERKPKVDEDVSLKN